MKYLITISIAAFYCSTMHGQSDTGSNCIQYHKGKFNYVDTSGNVIRVVKKKNFQTEYNDSKDTWAMFRITWISDCEYQLEQTATKQQVTKKNES